MTEDQDKWFINEFLNNREFRSQLFAAKGAERWYAPFLGFKFVGAHGYDWVDLKTGQKKVEHKHIESTSPSPTASNLNSKIENPIIVTASSTAIKFPPDSCLYFKAGELNALMTANDRKRASGTGAYTFPNDLTKANGKRRKKLIPFIKTYDEIRIMYS